MAEANRVAAVHSELLLELSFLVNERKSVDEVFSSFAKRLLEVADFDYTTLLTGVPGTGYFEVVASYPFELPGAKAGVTVATRSFKYDDLLAAQDGYEYTARADSTTPASRELAAAGMSRAWVSALVSGGEVYGAFTIARARPEPYTEDERKFMVQASRLLAGAVRQETELWNARRAAMRAEAANALALALNSGEHIESSFHRLNELVTTSIAADYVGLILDQGEGFVLVDEAPRGVHTGAPATEEGTRYILENLALTSFMQARPAKGASPSDALFDAGYKRIGVAVLRDGETPVGLLIFGRKRSLKFNSEEQVFIELVRSMLSETITNARRLARSEAEAARSHTLNEVALLLNQGESVESIFARLLDVLAGALDIDYLGLLETGAEPGTFRMVGSRPVLMRDAGAIATAEELRLDVLLQSDQPVVQYALPRRAEDSPFNRRASEAGMRRGAAVVIREGGEVVGFLSLARKRPSRFGEDEVAFIETLSAMLGQAIANERRLRRAEVAAARAAVLNQAALLMKQDEPAETMIAGLLPILRQAISFDYIALLEADFRGQELIMVASEPRLGRKPGDRLPLSESLVENMTRAARPVLQFRMEDIAGTQPGVDSLREAGMKRGAAALLRDGEDIIGIFTLERRDPARLDDQEMKFILTLANMLGQAIANRRRLEAAERQALRSRLLNDIAVELDAGETMEEIFSRLPEMLARVLEFDHVGLVTALPDHRGLRVTAAHGDPGAPIGTVIPWPERDVERTLGRRPILQFNPQETAGAGAEILAGAGYTRVVTAVIREAEQVFGSLQFARYQPLSFTREERDFIETLATLLSRAMGNQDHLEKARAEAERTRLLNELAVLLHNGEGPERMFHRLTERLATVIKFDALALLVSEGADQLRVADSLRRRSMRPGTTFHIDDLGNAPEHLTGPNLVWQAPIEEVKGNIGRLTEEAGIRHAAIAALRHNQAIAGYMFVARTERLPFTAEETAYIELLATMVAQAIANHRKVEESRAEAIRSQVLSELTVLLQEGDAFTAGFDRISDLLLQAVGFDHISVTVRQPNGEGYHAIRSDELTLDGESIAFQPEGIEVITGGGQMSRQYRTATSPRAVPRALHQAGFERACTAVIVSDEGVEGLVTIGRKADLRFDDKEITFIELVAALIGQASANYRKAWVKQQEAEEQAIIAEAASAVARELTALGIVAALRESVSRFISEPFCNFGYLVPGGVLFSAPGRPEIPLPIGPGFRRALENGYDLVPPNSAAGGSPESRVESERIGLQSHVITAAYSGGETVGLLIIGSRDPSFEPGAREVRLSRLIADIVGPAMANVRAVERQQQEAEDQRLLAQVAAVAARESEPAALLAALHQPMRAIVPSPTIIFGFRDGDNSLFPRLDGSYATVPLDTYARMLDDVGQIHSDEIPEDLFPESELWTMGLHAISSTAVRAGGKTVGYLMVASRARGYAFGERELRLFRLLAQIVGPAMENGRAAEKARDDAEEQSILAEAAASLAAAATEEEVIATLTPAVSRFVRNAVATVFFVEGDDLVSPIGLGRDKYRPIAGEAMTSGQVCVEKPWPELSPLGARMLEAASIERFVNTSLNAGGTSTGILFVGTTDAGTTFGPRELRLISLIADMAGPALANARESRRRKDDAEEQRFLAEAAAVAAGATSDIELVRRLAKPFASLIPGSKIDLLYLLEDCAVSATVPEVRMPLGRGFQIAIETGQSYGGADDPGSSPEARARQAEMGISSGVSTRLSSRGETLGLFWLGTTRDERLTERDLRICRLVADVVGPALANLRESRRRKEDAEEQRFLAEAAAAAASAATQDDLVRRLARPFRALIPGSRMDLFYLDGEILRSTVTGSPYSIGPHFERALATGQWLGEPYASGGTPEADAGLTNLGIVQAASTRLSSEGKPLGVLWIGTTDPERLLSDRDLRICRLVGDVVGPAFANLRESQRRQEDAEEQRFLAAVAGRAATATTERELSAALREPFRQFTPGVTVNFFFREGETLRGADDSVFPIGPQVHRTFRDGQCVGGIEDDDVIPTTRAELRKAGIARWVLTAAVSEGEALGLLHVSTADAGKEFQERELRLFRLASDIVGPAMAHLRESRRRKEDAEEQRFLAADAAAAARAAAAAARAAAAAAWDAAADDPHAWRAIDPAGLLASLIDPARAER